MPPIQIRLEMLKDLLFILPILLGAATIIILKKTIPSFSTWIDQMLGQDWLSALSGAFFGAMVGAGLVWGARILGTLWFGRIAMGLGDVHLMFGIGAIVGASQSAIIFFAAPFMAIAVGLWGFITRKQRELPYGPYLSMATAVILLFHAPIEAYLSPGFNGLFDRLRNIIGL
jgi:leader peptidase (prepilin peptidase)/N-methyltransferase